jgi:hypothetical protein
VELFNSSANFNCQNVSHSFSRSATYAKKEVALKITAAAVAEMNEISTLVVFSNVPCEVTIAIVV